jgi:bifunctional UDP-N-acetylglucosamine pyrophosphorylase/glucosamine-1-phosphate N-acetyltransferase
MKNITAIVLAAGKGTRFNTTRTNKLVRELAGRPMISYTADLLKNSGIKSTIFVVGFKKSSITRVLGHQYTYAVQEEVLGTADAVKSALPSLTSACQQVLVLNADDSAFYLASDISRLINTHLKTQADMTIMTVVKKDPQKLGRIIRDKSAKVRAIVEFKNATKKQKNIKEVNTATYCFKRAFLEAFIDKIKKDPVSKEYYLTDMLAMAVKNKKKVSAVKLTDPERFHSINTPEDLQRANIKMETINL